MNQPQRISPVFAEEPHGSTLNGPRIVGFLWSHRIVILATALAAVLAATTYSLLFVPRLYQGVAMLTISPSPLSSQLRAEPLTTEGHRRLLESDEVVNETRRRMIEQGLLSADLPLSVGQGLGSRVGQPSAARGAATASSPLLEAIATHESNQTAASIANTWAEVFFEHSQARLADGLVPTLSLIESEYQRHRDELAELRQSKVEATADYNKLKTDAELRWLEKISELEARWDRRLVEVKKDTTDVTAPYQAETRRIIEGHAASQGPGLISSGAETTSGGGEVVDEPRITGGEPALLSLLRQLVTLRIQLAQTVPVIVLEKAITEDALWQALALQETPTAEVENLGSRVKLLTEEVNPISTEVALRIAQIETSLSASVDDPQSPLLEIASELEALQRQRSAGLSKILADRKIEFDKSERARSLELTELRKNRQLEVGALEEEWQAKVREVDQDLAQKEARMTDLADLNSQAQLAKAEQTVADVRLTTRAMPAQVALPRGLIRRATLAGALGLLLGLALALFREHGNARPEQTGQRRVEVESSRS